MNYLSIDLEKIAFNALKAGINEVLPENCIKKNLSLINKQTLKIQDQIFYLRDFQQINLIAFGKASIEMSNTLIELLPVSEGIIVSNKDWSNKYSALKNFTFIKAGHPVPDENSFLAGKKIMEFAEQTENEHLTFVLISGGGSALVEHSEIHLMEYQNITNLLLKSGATIDEINIVRKQISLIKGGRLIKKIKGKVISLILSDVVGDKLDTIASGPTFYDNSTFYDAIEILKKYNIIQKISEKVLHIIENGNEMPLNQKEFQIKDIENIIIGSNRDACIKIIGFLKQNGFEVLYLGSQIQGEAREVAKVFGGIAAEIYNENIKIKKPAAIVAGGETTVTVKGKGKGGRNQELALAMFPYIEKINGLFLSFGTDGIDGPTDAAGAIMYKSYINKAYSLKLDWKKYLSDNNSYNFFKQTGGLIKTGATGTNVADIQIFLCN
jgi:hydroxypyruvate reductase/glycerate 2-kinase